MTPNWVAATPIAAIRRNARRRRSPSLNICLSPNGVDQVATCGDEILGPVGLAALPGGPLPALPPGQVRKRHLIQVIRRLEQGAGRRALLMRDRRGLRDRQSGAGEPVWRVPELAPVDV